MRDAALAQIWESIQDRAGCTFEQYTAAARDWVVLPILSGDAIVGGVLIRHNEIHVGVSRTPGACSRKQIRAVMNKAISTFGSIVTTVYPSNPAGVEFCKRLGFEVTWEDEETIQMRATRCNYA